MGRCLRKSRVTIFPRTDATVSGGTPSPPKMKYWTARSRRRILFNLLMVRSCARLLLAERGSTHMRRSEMKSHRLPFENRWTAGERAWRWYCELERIGVPNVRAMFADHEMHHADDNSVVFDVPAGFVRDWLSFHDRQDGRRQTQWLASVAVLAFVAAVASVVAVLRIWQ
jgi:hypothetical protein